MRKLSEKGCINILGNEIYYVLQFKNHPSWAQGISLKGQSKNKVSVVSEPSWLVVTGPWLVQSDHVTWILDSGLW